MKSNRYVYEGVVIRLTAADYDRWRRSFADLEDFDGELDRADTWYAAHPHGKWFHAVAAWLRRANDAARKENDEARKARYEFN